MLNYLFDLASSHSDELYSLGCYAGSTLAGYTSAGEVIFYAICIA
jgi:hypothetical protein